MDRAQRLKECLERAKIVAKRLATLEPENYSSTQNTRTSGKKTDRLQNQPNKPTSNAYEPLEEDPTRFSTVSEDGLIREEMAVPPFFILLLAAHRGDYTKFIENETGAKVSPNTSCGSATDERQITITGSCREFVDQAKTLISNELSTKTHCLYFVPANRMGAVIGRGGEGIKSLQDRTGCWMFVTQEGNEMTGPEKPINIFGTQAQIQEGKGLVNEVVYGAKPGDSVRIFHVPDYVCSELVGKKAENIKYLQQTSNTTIFLDNAIGTDKRRMYICGSLDCINHAQRLIEEQLGVQVEQLQEQEVGSMHSNTQPNPVPSINEQAMPQVEGQLDANTVAAYYTYYANLAIQYPEYAPYYQMLQQQLLIQSQNPTANTSKGKYLHSEQK